MVTKKYLLKMKKQKKRELALKLTESTSTKVRTRRRKRHSSLLSFARFCRYAIGSVPSTSCMRSEHEVSMLNEGVVALGQVH